MRLSFKRHARLTGIAGVGYPYRVVDIKVDGKVVGAINPPTWESKDDMWKVHVAVIKNDINEDGNPNCKWKWYKMAALFWSEADARDYLKTYKEDIFKLNLHYFES